MTPTCPNCLFFIPLDGAEEGTGTCHRFPPSVTVLMVPTRSVMTIDTKMQPQNFSAYPMVRRVDWCGELMMEQAPAH